MFSEMDGQGRKSGSSKSTPARPAPRRGYGGRTQDELREERRRRLLDSALELFATRGYHGTPIDVLCADAKVTTRHFYDQFEGREALLVSVYDEVVDRAMRDIGAALSKDTSIEVRVESAVRAFVRAYLDDPRRGRIACIEVVGVSHAMAQRRQGVIHGFARLLETYTDLLVREEWLPQRSYRLSCVALVGAVNELMIEWLFAGVAVDSDRVTEEILHLFWSVMNGAREPRVISR